MTVWFIDPHDPLIVRDGRPFGPQPGAQATSLPFPFPSTTTGGVRTRAGLQNGTFDKSKANIERVKKIKVRGPLLIQLHPDGNTVERLLVHAPADALFLSRDQSDQKDQPICRRLLPLEMSEGTITDFDKHELNLVGLAQSERSKPAKNTPSYWYWETLEKWLIDPSIYDGKQVSLTDMGHNGPQRERRIHVSIDAETSTGKEGALFGTSGLDFTYPGKGDNKSLSEGRKLALAVAVNDLETPGMLEGIAALGGERRMVCWRKSSLEFPSCPEDIEKAIIRDKACRLVLLTPGCFTQGYKPSQIMNQNNGVTVELKAIAVQRPQVVSGWDLERGTPKPTRRLAPAGTVFFLSVKGSDNAIRDWVRNTWMQCISDDEQYLNDGFGLAGLGTWSRIPEKIQLETLQ